MASSQNDSPQKQMSEEERADIEHAAAIREYTNVLLKELVQDIAECARELNVVAEGLQASRATLRRIEETYRQNAELEDRLYYAALARSSMIMPTGSSRVDILSSLTTCIGVSFLYQTLVISVLYACWYNR